MYVYLSLFQYDISIDHHMEYSRPTVIWLLTKVGTNAVYLASVSFD